MREQRRSVVTEEQRSLRRISTGKKMRVGFTLEDGAQLVFDASDKPLLPPNAPARRKRPSRS